MMINYFIYFMLAVLVYGEEISFKECASDVVSSGLCVPFYLCTHSLNDSHRAGCSVRNEFCCHDDNISQLPLPERFSGCGLMNANTNNIPNSKSESSEKFPWMVAILRDVIEDTGATVKVYKCGGALVHWKGVVTTAQCVSDVKNSERLTVRVGEWDTETKPDSITHQDRKVVKVVPFKSVIANNPLTDITVLILESEITPTEYVNVICLPESTSYVEVNHCILTEWSMNNFGKKGQILVKKLPIVNEEKCQNALQKTRLGPSYSHRSNFVCAGGNGGNDTCTGLKGSPLICPVRGYENKYELTGMYSWSVDCDVTGTPGIYIKVPYFRYWIDEELTKANIANTDIVNRFFSD